MKQADAMVAAKLRLRDTLRSPCETCGEMFPGYYLVTTSNGERCIECHTSSLPAEWPLERRTVMDDSGPIPMPSRHDLNLDDITEQSASDEAAFYYLTDRLAIEATASGRVIYRMAVLLKEEKRKQMSTLRDAMRELQREIDAFGFIGPRTARQEIERTALRQS